jgi:spore maturation protein A
VKLKAITQAAIDFANMAVEISIGLIGVMALWLGLIKIAEEAGFVKVLTRILAPVTKRLFPDIPADHPAIGAIIMNTAANMLGLSNAATPMGLKAMEELNKLNPKAGTATNAMVTFLAINTGGLILIPATAIAVRAAAGSANPGIIIGTAIFGAGCATVTGVVASKILQRLPTYKKELNEEQQETKENDHG